MKKFCAVLLLAITGCASSQHGDSKAQLEPLKRVPDAIVGFTSGSAAFNNVSSIENQVIEDGVVLVANANRDNYVLAEQRLQAIAESLLDKKEVFVSYRFSDRVADRDLVEVFGFGSSNEVAGILKQVNTFSLDSALGLRFSEQDTRGLEFEVRRKTIRVPIAESPESQLKVVLADLGWAFKGKLDLRGENDVVMPVISFDMDVVIVDASLATESELRSVISEWLKVYGVADKGFSVALDHVAKGVVIFR